MAPKSPHVPGKKAAAADVPTVAPAESSTPAEKGKRGRPAKAEGETPAKRGRPKKSAESKEELPKSESGELEQGKSEQLEQSQSAELEAEATTKAAKAAPKGRAKKPKPEGPYTKYKDVGGGIIPEAALPRSELDANDAAQRLKVVAWNLGGLRAFLKNKSADLEKLVSQEKPDIFGIAEHKLQEGDTEDSISALHTLLPDYTCQAVNCSTAKKGYSGVLVLVRKDLTPAPLSVTASDLPAADKEGRVITIDFERLSVLFAYVPSSGDGLKRLDERVDKWDVQLRERLVALAKEKPTMLIGDLNVARLDLDIWNVEAPHIPKSASTTPQERQSFEDLLAAGFVDSFRHVHPDAEGAFTYWSVRAGNKPKNRGLRLDYIIVSKSMAQSKEEEKKTGEVRLIDAFHLPALAPGGDHCPVGATIAI